MPLYEYQCTDCQAVFDKIVSYSEANRPPACPICAGENTRRKISKIAAMTSSSSSSGESSASSCGTGGRFT